MNTQLKQLPCLIQSQSKLLLQLHPLLQHLLLKFQLQLLHHLLLHQLQQLQLLQLLLQLKL
jgi:hypothetical protein